MTKPSGDSKNTLYCSFCGKSQHEVRKLIAGPTVFICDECVELCMDIIREETKNNLVKSSEGVPTPRDICNVLDDYVIGQSRAKQLIVELLHERAAIGGFIARRPDRSLEEHLHAGRCRFPDSADVAGFAFRRYARK